MTEPVTTPGVAPGTEPASPIATVAGTAAAESAATSVAPSVLAATPVPAPADEAAATAKAPRARPRLLAGLTRLARFAVMVAIFAVGVGLGYVRFQAVQSDPSTAGAPATSGVETPDSVQGLVQALDRNDLEAARSAVRQLRDEQGQLVADPYLLLAGELRSMQMQEVREVRTLSTFADGPRSATAIVISGRTTQGADLGRHLVVQTLNGTIVDFK